MKQTFTRFLFYLFIIIVVTGMFRASWPDPASTEPFTAKLTFYMLHYGVGWLFWSLLLTSTHLLIAHFRRPKLTVPDTQPLIDSAAKLLTKDYDARFNELMRQKLAEQQANNPTKPIDNP